MQGKPVLLIFYCIILGMGIIASGMVSVFVVSGESMNPSIVNGDLLIVLCLPSQKLESCDIIAFRPHHGEEWQGAPIAHRIVAIDDVGHITTKGDNVKFADPYEIYPSDVIGRVVLVLPGAGAVMRVATSVYGYVWLVLIPYLWLILNELGYLRGWRARPR